MRKRFVFTTLLLLCLLALSPASAVRADEPYIVRPGDTLIRIAHQFGVSLDELVVANQIANPNAIFVGQRLVIPGVGVRGGDAHAGATHDAATTMYKVQAGDNLYRLANRFGTTVAAISEANRLKGSVIFVGQMLTIPGASPAAGDAHDHARDHAPPPTTVAEAPAAALRVPTGFRATLIAKLPDGMTPTSLTYGPDGRLYVAAVPNPFDDESRIGTIYVFAGFEPQVYATGFLLPSGVAFQPGTRNLFVAHRASDREGQLSIVAPDGSWGAVVRNLPCCYTSREHQPNGVVFGPDGFLYLAIGARSDHGPQPDANGIMDIHPLEAGILRISPDGSTVEKYADGLRNPYDLAFDARGQLWTADNGPDYGPPERLHRVERGGHYGFPFYEDCGACPRKPAGLNIIPPTLLFPPHATPAGLTAYDGHQFPAAYADSLFLALWNPWVSPGVFRIHDGRSTRFVSGLTAPVDVSVAPDGSLVVAEFFSGSIYRVRWIGSR